MGQKLSLIGLKSDLASKLIKKDPDQARNELKDVQQTARTALNEVRKMVSQMRGIRLKEEIVHVKELLEAAQIKLLCDQDFSLPNISIFLENILSMCMKEAVTNIVKHSKATTCKITMEKSINEICLTVWDNGIGIHGDSNLAKGNGLNGMKERLEFVNGSLEIVSDQGTKLMIRVPNMVIKQAKEDGIHD